MRLSPLAQEWIVVIVGYGLLAWHPNWLPIIGIHAILFLLLCRAAAERCSPVTLPVIERLVIGTVLWSCLLILFLTAAYYASIPLTYTTMIAIEVIAAAMLLLVPPSIAEELPEENRSLATGQTLLLGITFLIGFTSMGVLVRSAILHQTTVSVRTPWALLPNGFFLAFAMLFACGLISARIARRAENSWLATAAWFSASLLTVLLYPLGYGFDGFIHRASEQLLLSTGTLTPKPLYYMGQYVWTTWLATFTDLSIGTIDRWLVPATIFLVGFALYGFLRRASASMQWMPWIFLLCIPLAPFTATTPQSWSYLLGMSALLFALWRNLEKRLWVVPLLLVGVAVMAHPLGGLPFACVVGALWLCSNTTSRGWQRLWQATGLVSALLVVPLALWAQSRLGTTPIEWSFAWLRHLELQDIVPKLLFSPRQTLTLWIDATEWTSLGITLATLMLGGWLLVRPQHPYDRMLAGTGLGLRVAQIILERAATFSFLISYERGNYTERLGVMSAILLAIPVARWASRRMDDLGVRSGFLWTFTMLACVGLWSVRVYDALPRHDAAQASSGWSVGRADTDAVRWMHDQAKTKRYTVLANQTVSAAALQYYGFARYHETVFYYPLPTGGPLYQLFLEAASTNATSSTIERAAALTNSEIVYVVINDYWWNAERVREHLASFAARDLSFGEGRVWVYEFPIASSMRAASPPTLR